MKIEEAIKQKAFEDPYHKAVVNLLYTHSYLVSHQSKVFKPYGLSPEQYNVLRIIRGRHPGPISVSSIQDRMLNRMSNASRLVEKLKQKNLVERIESAADRRQVDVSISPQGHKLLSVVEHEVHKLNQDMLHLDPQEVNVLNRLLDKLRG